ncbi:ribosome biogenesis GTPase Der [Candidatus Peregrinibacteria bacterium CG_4_10_14_0_2_um_filter_38_24]|nr:MAG: ribosome biogenesis GTPase Der [Candidatus Peregrinibacteria bacterium CG_4_10_14_0_2_um_filter_38_24]PJC39290.1 MAG: ribosome biogenesis GTPase Der [Candidatus Peregrinibacteria bacterium CG_4_9_14_0_2_um_filter_38_9]
MEALPVIAIVGRPNVGKSTLFNRLVMQKYAITSDIAGTTRDRIYKRCEIAGYEVTLVDTGGLEYGKHENIEKDVQSQAALAIEEADLILFIVDLSEGVNPNDQLAANALRKSKKEVLFIANKSDAKNAKSNSYETLELGFGEALKISAIHTDGLADLELLIEKTLRKLKFKKRRKKEEKNSDTLSLCILGRPNAGKSSLVNAITGTEAIIVSDIPGTTRDHTDTLVTHDEKKYNLIDTAGLRRRGKIEQGIEKFSSLRCLNALQRSDIAVLLIDGTERIAKQDAHIVEYILEMKKGLIIAVNKIDDFDKSADEEKKNMIIYRLKRRFAFVPWAPVVFISAKNKTNVMKIFDLADEIKKEREKKINTPELNSFMQMITNKHLPSSANTRKPKFLYISQVETSPPSFVLFFKSVENLHFSYPRYIENELRREYGFVGTSINLKFKSKV